MEIMESVDTLMQSIDDMEILDYEAENNPEERFNINNDLSADWAMRKIAQVEAECQRLNAVRQARIDMLKRAMEEERERTEMKTAYLKGLLREYFEGQEKKETKIQFSYRLPSGNLVLKKAKQEMMPNNEALVEWLSQGDMADFLKTEVSPRWGKLKGQLKIVDGDIVFTETGEVVPAACISVETKPEQFEVKLK